MKKLSLFIAMLLLGSGSMLAQVGIGTENPEATLDVHGTLKFSDGNQGANKVLTSDGSGFASWEDSSLEQLAANNPNPPGCYGLCASTSTGDGPYSIAVAGDYAYVVNNSNDNIVIYNISDPANVVSVDTIASGGDSPISIAVSGNYVYVVNLNSNNMVVFDASDPEDTFPVDTVASGGFAPRSVAVSGNYAYVVNYYNNINNNLVIYDVTEPANTSLLSTIGSGGIYPVSIAVSGNYVYIVNAFSNNLVSFNVTDPYNPALGATIASSGINPQSVKVSGDFAYVVNTSSNNMIIFDITDPEAPFPVDTIDSGGIGPRSVAVSGNYAFVVNVFSNNMVVYNVSTPSAPYEVWSTETGSDPHSLDVSAGYAYVLNYSSNNMQIFRLTCPQSILVEDGEISALPSAWFVSGNDIFKAYSGNIGIGISNTYGKISFPNDGSSISWGNNYSRIYDSLHLHIETDDHMYFDDNSGTTRMYIDTENGKVGIGTTSPEASLDVVGTLKISDGNEGANKVLTSDENGNASWQESELSSLTSGISEQAGCYELIGSAVIGNSPTDVYVTEDYLYTIDDENNGMSIFDISSPYNPVLLGFIATGSDPTSITVSGNYAYVVDGESDNLVIIDISTPSSPFITGSVTTENYPQAVTIQSNYVYILSASGYMEVIDVLNPYSPTITGSIGTGVNSYPVSLTVRGNYAYVLNYDLDNMLIIDITTPSSPSQVGTVPTGHSPWAITASGQYLYVLNDSDHTMSIYSITNPSNPLLITSIGTGDNTYPSDAAVYGNFAYVVNAGGVNNMCIFDISTPSAPFLANSIETSGSPVSIAVSENFAFIVNFGGNDLEIIQITCPQSILFQGGILSTAPSDWFATGNDIYNLNTNNVGIGTTSPSKKLDVAGTIKMPDLLFYPPTGDPSPTMTSRTVPAGQGESSEKTELILFHGNDPITSGPDQITLRAPALSFQTFNNTAVNNIDNDLGYNVRMYINPSGNVGIGTTSPTEKLDVNGTIKSQDFKAQGPTGFRFYDDNSGGYLLISNAGNSYISSNTGSTASTVIFTGSVDVLGTLSKGGGSFKIDHPLDPENKFLYHSFVESPDMMNVYNGNVILDGNGEATIELPDYFEALNGDYRYQLTPVGAASPGLYIAQEVENGKFRIAGGTAGVKVSWQVTGIRRDAFAETYRIPTTVEKNDRERGKYLHPEVFGKDDSMRMSP